jgi:hypothetical protein
VCGCRQCASGTPSSDPAARAGGPGPRPAPRAFSTVSAAKLFLICFTPPCADLFFPAIPRIPLHLAKICEVWTRTRRLGRLGRRRMPPDRGDCGGAAAASLTPSPRPAVPPRRGESPGALRAVARAGEPSWPGGLSDHRASGRPARGRRSWSLARRRSESESGLVSDPPAP